MRCLFIVGVLTGAACAVTPAPRYSLAGGFSPEWRALAAEVRALDAAMARLPDIPAEDLGGTRPFLRVFNAPGTLIKSQA
jgi:hypothetical protein